MDTGQAPAASPTLTGRPDHALDVLSRHLADVENAIHEAQLAHARLAAAANVPDIEPAHGGHLQGLAEVAMWRWTEAIGARAALEAVYQELSGGEPSPLHARSTEVLAAVGLTPNTVGLQPVPAVTL